VILVRQRRSHSEVTEQYGTVVVDEQVGCLDIPVDKSVDVQIAIVGLRKRSRGGRMEKLA
jgi:predicted protein tyrosine phosphatase